MTFIPSGRVDRVARLKVQTATAHAASRDNSRFKGSDLEFGSRDGNRPALQ